ncbi:unnamed protein product [Cylicostephanus goldi]|uniref:Dienelactone hydrolase domain-containing protein n=1 Tax=Cylicostephanus goldi TaxID=71465 RepID=A0A3P6SYF3_CYLGO|nr:unnamed protein product [Cylicostephanus goldi]
MAAPPLLPTPKGPYEEKLVEYGAYNGTVLQGLLVYHKSIFPKKATPAIIVFHAFTGRTEFENQKARDLAKVS